MINRLRLVSLLLFASLAINLFLGGLMVGRWIDPRHPHSPPRMEHETRAGAPPGWMRRALGPEGAVALEDAWQSHAPAIDPLRDELRRSRAAVRQALAAEPFDPAAYAEALQAMQASTAQLHTAINAVMVEVAVRLTPEQRASVVERGREWERHKAGRE